MKNFYLTATVIGAIVPYIFFLNFFAKEGFALQDFILGLFVNGAAGGFTADILISSAVFWAYLISKAEKGIWVYILLNLSIGLSCALPFYLYRKEKEASKAISR